MVSICNEGAGGDVMRCSYGGGLDRNVGCGQKIVITGYK